MAKYSLVAPGGAELNDPAAELYDPATDSFTIINGAPRVGVNATVTLLADGRVLIAGGFANYEDMYVGPSEIFDPATGQFSSSGALAVPRLDHTATLLPDGNVLMAGGLVDAEGDNPPTDTTEIYDPVKGTFSLGPPMLYSLAGHTATLLSDGSVLIAGGEVQAQIFR